MTFRGTIQDRAQATAREVISYIEQWITSADVVNIPVHHARLNINNTCVVLLASLDDLECPGYLVIPTEPMFITTTYTTSPPPSATASDAFRRTLSTAIIAPQLLYASHCMYAQVGLDKLCWHNFENNK